jgi:hypothetical protein
MNWVRLWAGFVGVCGVLLVQLALGADNVVVTAQAREHFNAGVAYLDDPNGSKFEEAYREFHLAYAESPSYKILANIGLCALNLERDGEAIEAYESFLARATPSDIPKDKRALMERDITTLKASLVRLLVTTVPASITLVDERIPSKGTSVINRYDSSGGTLSLGIHPGHHRITASAEGYEPQIWEFDANSASRHERAFSLKAIATAPTTGTPRSTGVIGADVATSVQPQKTPTLVYVGLVATGVFAVGATVTGLLSNSKRSDYNDVNRTGENPGKARDLRDSVERLELMTDIGIGAAVLAATGTAIVYFTSGSSKPAKKASTSRWQLEPAVGPTQASVSLIGQF